jgi:protein O-mannosyl-transferase
MTVSKALILVFIVTIFAYSNVLDGEFQFDDDLAVTGNPYVTGSSRFSWNNLGENAAKGVRPFTTITFALNYRFGGLDTRWYHATNLAIHLFNGLLLFVFVLRTFRSPKLPDSFSSRPEITALISSAVFLLHPIQTEAVSYISQRSEALASLFFLCALVAYIEAVNTDNKINSKILYAASALCCLCAISSKEIAVTIPVVMLVYDFYFLKYRPFLRRIAFPGILLLLSLTAGLYVLANMGSGADAGFSVKAFTPFQYLMTQLRVIVTYMRLLVLPVDQNLDYDFKTSTSLFESETALSLLLISALLTIAAASFKKWRTGSFFMFWFFIIIAPTSSIIPVIDPIYEHRVYLASAGFFIIFAGLLSGWIFNKGNLEKRMKIAAIFLVILSVSLSAATFQRNRVWQTKLALWEDVVKKSPLKSRPRNNLGNCYMLVGDHFRAVEEYRKAIVFDKNNIEAYYNLGMGLEKTGRPDEAAFYYDIFSRNAPAVHAVQKQAALERINEIRRSKKTEVR